MKAVGVRLVRIAAWTVTLAAGVVIVLAVVLPRIANATPYAITSRSMEPALDVGDLAVSRPVDADDLAVGDVVTIQLESGQPIFATHRVVEVQHRLDGEVLFITQGDANPSPDAEPRLAVQIRGKMWYSLPLVGHLSSAMTGEQRHRVVTAISVMLLGYAVAMFAGAWRDRRDGRATLDDIEPADETIAGDAAGDGGELSPSSIGSDR